MKDFPNDVLNDILTRLPVKSLLRFRSVSKPFCVLIDSPDFIKQHLKHSLTTKSNHALILRDYNLYSVGLYTLDQTVELQHPLKTENYGTKILGSVNGLLALFNGEKDIVIWNLATKNYQKVPVSEIEFPGSPDALRLYQFTVYGFGYDSVSDDYKLLRLVQFYDEDPEAKVYSLRSNSWQRIKDFPYHLRYKQGYGELACGALHWIVSRKNEFDAYKFIAAFDLATNEYRLVAPPDLPKEEFRINVGKVDINVGKLEDSLCLICTYINDHVDVWVMKNYGVKESWSKLLSISQPKVIHSFIFVLPLAYSERGDEIMLVQDSIKLFWYNLEEGKAREINFRGYPRFFKPFICVESLVPLGGKTQDYANKRDGQGKEKERISVRD